MRPTTAPCGLAFLITTLIVAAASLPQSSSLLQSASDLSNSILRRTVIQPPPNWIPPINCVGIGAHEIQQNQKRDLQLSENNTAALQPRADTAYACGQLNSGWQSDTFQFFATTPVQLAWNIGHDTYKYARETVTLMKVGSNGGRDTVVGGITDISNWRNSAFTPVVGALYYVQLKALPHRLITWWIAPFA